MPMTFDANLKERGRDSPQGILSLFDEPPTAPVSLLNVDLSTVIAAADLVLGLGQPVKEIIQIEFQSSAAPWKHSRLMVYNALLYDHHHVPVHSVLVLLRPQATHPNLKGSTSYAPRPGRGSMQFGYEIVRLWEIPAEELLAADVGVTPLAVLGRLPESVSTEDGLALVAQRLAERAINEAAKDVAGKLLTNALLLAGLRVRRDAASRIFRGIRAMEMEDSDTYLMILDEGKEKQAKEAILLFAEEKIGSADESIKAELNSITDLERLKRLIRRAAKAATWREILDTP